METRLKLLALAFAAPLALAACGDEEAEQTAEVEVEEPAVQEEAAEPEAERETAVVTEQPAGGAGQPAGGAGQPAAGADQPAGGAGQAGGGAGQAGGGAGQAGGQQTAQAPEAGAGGGAAGAGGAGAPGGAAGGQQANFTGNWAMQGEACPGEWEFTEQTIEVPEQGTFQVQDVQQNGQEVELEVTSTEGQQTQTLTLEFPDAQQQDTMVVRNAGDEVTLQRCQ